MAFRFRARVRALLVLATITALTMLGMSERHHASRPPPMLRLSKVNVYSARARTEELVVEVITRHTTGALVERRPQPSAINQTHRAELKTPSNPLAADSTDSTIRNILPPRPLRQLWRGLEFEGDLIHWKKSKRKTPPKFEVETKENRWALPCAHPPCSAIATPYDLVLGGGERYLLMAAYALQQLGHFVDVIVFNNNVCQDDSCLRDVAAKLRVGLDLERVRLCVREKVRFYYSIVDPAPVRYQVFFLLGAFATRTEPEAGRGGVIQPDAPRRR